MLVYEDLEVELTLRGVLSPGRESRTPGGRSSKGTRSPSRAMVGD